MREAAKRKNVFVNLSGVKTMTPDAVAGLLAAVHHCELDGSQVAGNVPSDPLPREMLNDSGFRNYVRSSPGYRQTVTPHGQIVRREAGGEAFYNRFDQHLANRLIQFANLNSKAQGPSFSVLCEAMLNTMNHASEEGRSREPWWASAYLDSSRNRVCFTFIDQGVGIFRSYSLVMWWRMLAPRAFLNRGEILRRLFQRQIPSSTKIPGRGNGIPEMYEHCKAGRIRNLTVIANNGMGNAETETYQQLSNSFPGTLLYWEI